MSFDWIKPGQKFAILALSVNYPNQGREYDFSGGVSIRRTLGFEISSIWKDWLGSIRIEQVQKSNLFAIKCVQSDDPFVINKEDHQLRLDIEIAYISLFVSGFTPIYSEPVLLSGAFRDAKPDVRQVKQLCAPTRVGYYNIADQSIIDFCGAEKIYDAIAGCDVTHRSRLNIILNTYLEARRKAYMLDRIHQYVRVVEAFILPEIGRTKKQFKSRTELFIGSKHHASMDEIYDIRSNVEHMKDFRSVSENRAARLRHLSFDIMMENLARLIISKTLTDQRLFSIFMCEDQLRYFWSQDNQYRKSIWGSPIEFDAVMKDFSYNIISNEQLGLTH